MGQAMKRAAIYLRVSTQDQTTSNQEHELRLAADQANWQVARVYKDHGISGAKGRNGPPAFDALCRDATKRQFDVVMAWNVDRLGRSLKERIGASRCTKSRFRLNLAAASPQHIAKIEWCRRIGGIAFHQNAIEALGFGMVPVLLCCLSLLK
jgi:hypothetical protein